MNVLLAEYSVGLSAEYSAVEALVLNINLFFIIVCVQVMGQVSSFIIADYFCIIGWKSFSHYHSVHDFLKISLSHWICLLLGQFKKLKHLS